MFGCFLRSSRALDLSLTRIRAAGRAQAHRGNALAWREIFVLGEISVKFLQDVPILISFLITPPQMLIPLKILPFFRPLSLPPFVSLLFLPPPPVVFPAIPERRQGAHLSCSKEARDPAFRVSRVIQGMRGHPRRHAWNRLRRRCPRGQEIGLGSPNSGETLAPDVPRGAPSLGAAR